MQYTFEKDYFDGKVVKTSYNGVNLCSVEVEGTPLSFTSSVCSDMMLLQSSIIPLKMLILIISCC